MSDTLPDRRASTRAASSTTRSCWSAASASASMAPSGRTSRSTASRKAGSETAVGKTLDRRGQPMTIKLKGKVEPICRSRDRWRGGAVPPLGNSSGEPAGRSRQPRPIMPRSSVFASTAPSQRRSRRSRDVNRSPWSSSSGSSVSRSAPARTLKARDTRRRCAASASAGRPRTRSRTGRTPAACRRGGVACRRPSACRRRGRGSGTPSARRRPRG